MKGTYMDRPVFIELNDDTIINVADIRKVSRSNDGGGWVYCVNSSDQEIPSFDEFRAKLLAATKSTSVQPPEPQPLTLHDFEVGKTVLKSNRHGTMHVVSGVNHACVSVTPERDGVRSFTFGAIGELFSLVKDVTCVPATKEGLCTAN